VKASDRGRPHGLWRLRGFGSGVVWAFVGLWGFTGVAASLGLGNIVFNVVMVGLARPMWRRWKGESEALESPSWKRVHRSMRGGGPRPGMQSRQRKERSQEQGGKNTLSLSTIKRVVVPPREYGNKADCQLVG
jgi:hypothetical protein